MVKSARLCFGSGFVHAQSAEQLLVGRDLYNADTVAQVLQELLHSIQPEERPPEPSPEYRQKLACSLFYKFLLGSSPEDLVSERFRCGGQLLERPVSSGSQTFETIAKNYPITQPVQKLEGKEGSECKVFMLLQCNPCQFFKVPFSAPERPTI